MAEKRISAVSVGPTSCNIVSSTLVIRAANRIDATFNATLLLGKMQENVHPIVTSPEPNDPVLKSAILVLSRKGYSERE